MQLRCEKAVDCRSPSGSQSLHQLRGARLRELMVVVYHEEREKRTMQVVMDQAIDEIVPLC